MLVELLPEVQKLSASQKRLLAQELLELADGKDDIEVDPATLALLEQRLAEFDAAPLETSTWDEVRARIFQPRNG